jgi:hypothetical protein
MFREGYPGPVNSDIGTSPQLTCSFDRSGPKILHGWSRGGRSHCDASCRGYSSPPWAQVISTGALSVSAAALRPFVFDWQSPLAAAGRPVINPSQLHWSSLEAGPDQVSLRPNRATSNQSNSGSNATQELPYFTDSGVLSQRQSTYRTWVAAP